VQHKKIDNSSLIIPSFYEYMELLEDGKILREVKPKNDSPVGRSSANDYEKDPLEKLLEIQKSYNKSCEMLSSAKECIVRGEKEQMYGMDLEQIESKLTEILIEKLQLDDYLEVEMARLTNTTPAKKPIIRKQKSRRVNKNVFDPDKYLTLVRSNEEKECADSFPRYMTSDESAPLKEKQAVQFHHFLDTSGVTVCSEITRGGSIIGRDMITVAHCMGTKCQPYMDMLVEMARNGISNCIKLYTRDDDIVTLKTSDICWIDITRTLTNYQIDVLKKVFDNYVYLAKTSDIYSMEILCKTCQIIITTANNKVIVTSSNGSLLIPTPTFYI
jgi:hypothetical protein